MITSRIHTALPCLAMGTPVIFVDAALERNTERARVQEFLKYFNRVSIDEHHKIRMNFDMPEKLSLLKNPHPCWRERVGEAAEVCRRFVEHIEK